MFEPLRTKRLLLRPVRASDTNALFERRNDPAVAEMQDWVTPFVFERAESLIAAVADMDGPGSAGWWMLTIADASDTQIYGDLALKLENDGRSAEVGYSLAREHWGKGIASEALTGLLDWLFEDQGVTRVAAMLLPENHRSARLLETCGFVFEGHTRNSFWLGGENSDDWIYGLTPEQRTEWINRPRTAPEVVEFVEPSELDFKTMIGIDHHHSQKRFVSPVVKSLALVAVPPIEQGGRVDLWPRAVMADGEPAGFMIMSRITDAHPEPWIWRFLIDRRHQRRGIGKRAVGLAIDQAREWGASTLKLSFIEGVGSPRPLYLSMGFELTGEILDGETVAQLKL
ncbi:MAG: RimJ/RimL family protein N-acetyltransferase [Verrucomicrobiales bacterium]|jgi:RimJ/RimL family protein N-acetyltransferase